MNTIVMLLLIGSMAVSVPAQTNPVLMRGRWGGTVMQDGVKKFEGHQFFYTVSVHIVHMLEEEHSGTMWWPETGCRADLTFIHHAEDLFKFATTPIKGSPKICVPTMMTIRFLSRDKIEVAFFYRTVSKPIAQGTLTRLTPAEIKEPIQQ